MTKPSITSPCTAERHNLNRRSRIAEFSGDAGGGLMELRNDENTLVIDLYRMDDTVKIRCDPRHLELTPNQWCVLERLIRARKQAKA